MKKYKYLLLILVLVLFTGCINIKIKLPGFDNTDTNTIIDYDPVNGTPIENDQVEVEPGKSIKFNDNIIATSMECDYTPKLLFEYKNQKIYSYCVKDVTINGRALNKENVIELINELDNFNDNLVLTYKEGGTKIYPGYEMKVLRCNHLVDFSLTNQDIYIGDINLTYKRNFCVPNNNTITKRFKVTNIDGKYVTLSRDNETGTIYYDETIELEVGKTYDFELQIGEDIIYQDTIEQLFNLGSIIEIREVK